jgi:hypothetical protein
MGEGSAEDGHDRVACKLLYGAAVLLDPPPGCRVIESQRLPNVFRVGPIRSRRKADQVDEEDRDELALLA